MKREYLCVLTWTHREVLKSNTVGITRSWCKGELKLVDTFDDRRTSRDGALVLSVIEVWECVGCGDRISISEGKVLSAWRGPKNLAKALAAELDARAKRLADEPK